MPEVSSPFEIKEWTDGETVDWKLQSFDRGEMTITPRDGRPPKKVKVLRIWLDATQKQHAPYYWDLTSQRLVSQLEELLPPVIAGQFEVRITAIGNPPSTHFSVSRVPLNPAAQ